MNTRLLKIGELSRASGVPIATIRHYIRVGLLPGATLKTAKNFGYYDPSFVQRLRWIKRLQQEHGLPLSTIRALRDRIELRKRIAGHAAHAKSEVDADALKQRTGLPPDDFEALRAIGLLSDGVRFGEDDLRIAEAFAQARARGITRELLPAQALHFYVQAAQALLLDELAPLAAGAHPAPEKLFEEALNLGTAILHHLRRKMMGNGDPES